MAETRFVKRPNFYAPKCSRYRMIVFGPRGAISHLWSSPQPWAVISYQTPHRWISEAGPPKSFEREGYVSVPFFRTEADAQREAHKRSKATFRDEVSIIAANDSRNMALAELPYWQFVQMVRAVVIDRSEEPDAPRVKNRPVFESYRAVFDALNNPSEDETDEWLTRLPEAIL